VIEYHNRLVAIAPTRGGKSELLNVNASMLRGQWALLDPKDEFAIDDVEKVYDVDALDWQNERILHWVPPFGERDVWETFFSRAYALRGAGFTVVLHEAGFACEFQPSKIGPMHNRYVAQGEAHGLGYWAASTRPVCLPVFAITEPAHAFAFAEPMTRADDHRALAQALNITADDLRDAQTQIKAQLGERAFIWANRRAGEISSWRPLDDAHRSQNIVRRTTIE
jgi:hypothetical protein